MIHKIGYPYSYGDELTPKMAGNNRKQAVSYSVLIPSIWWHNLGFGEPIQSYNLIHHFQISLKPQLSE